MCIRDSNNSVMDYVCQLCDDDCAVSCEKIQKNAQEIEHSLNISDSQFKASVGWLIHFMRRYNLSLWWRTSLSQRLPRDYTDKVIESHRYAIKEKKKKERKKDDYILLQISKADQTPVFCEMPRKITVAPTGPKSILMKTTGAEKLCCTVMLCIL